MGVPIKDSCSPSMLTCGRARCPSRSTARQSKSSTIFHDCRMENSLHLIIRFRAQLPSLPITERTNLLRPPDRGLFPSIVSTVEPCEYHGNFVLPHRILSAVSLSPYPEWV